MTKQQTAAQISVCYKQHSPNEFTHRYIWKNVQLDHDFSVFRCAISAATLSTTMMMMTRYVWQISKNLERNKQTKKTIKKEQQHTHTRTKHLRNALRMISENKTTFNRHPWRKGCAFLSYFGMNTNLTRKKSHVNHPQKGHLQILQSWKIGVHRFEFVFVLTTAATVWWGIQQFWIWQLTWFWKIYRC